MARKTVYNPSYDEEKAKLINKENTDLMEEFLEYLHSTDRSDGTIEQYRNDIRIFFLFCLDKLENKSFVKITKRDIIKYQNFLLNEQKVSSARIRRLKSALSSMGNYIENILDEDFPNYRNIINKIPSPTGEPVREKLVLDAEEFEKLLKDLVDSGRIQQACYVALAGYCGARKSELLRFTLDDFKDENIQNGLYRTSEKKKTKGRGKAGKCIYKWTISKYFKPYLDLWLEERKKLDIDSEFLFVSKDIFGKWKQAEIYNVNDWTKGISKVLGQDFYSHAMRHYYTTSLYRAGIPTEIIKEISGWSSVEMVSRYTDIEASEEFNKYFGEDGIKEQEAGNINKL